MNRIKLSQKKLKQIIRESIKSTLNEGLIDKNTPITLGELIKAIGYTGNVNNLIQRAGTNKATPEQWANLIEKQNVGRNQALGTVYKQLANQIRQSVEDRSAVATGMEKSLNNGGEIRGQYDMPIKVNPKNFTTIAQAVQHIARQNPDRRLSFRKEFIDSTGIFNGLNLAQVQNTIANKIRLAKGTLQQTNPNAATFLSTIEQWIGQGAQYIPAPQLAQAFAALEKILNTSRNDTPIVAGFQKLLNLFGMKDAKGRPFAVDGAIGQNTSAALRQLGYKDIFAYANDIEAVQKALGLQKIDGIAGNDTINAIRNNGINSFEAIKSIARRQNPNDMINTNLSVQTNPQNFGPQLTAPAAQPGGLAENRKFKVTENELRQIIRESVNDVLRELRIK
jgi:hypothetical protein